MHFFLIRRLGSWSIRFIGQHPSTHASHHGRCYQTAKSWSAGKREEPEESSILEWNGRERNKRKERISPSIIYTIYTTTTPYTLTKPLLNGNPAGFLENRSSHIQGEREGRRGEFLLFFFLWKFSVFIRYRRRVTWGLHENNTPDAPVCYVDDCRRECIQCILL